jgi:hypothetical protein
MPARVTWWIAQRERGTTRDQVYWNGRIIRIGDRVRVLRNGYRDKVGVYQGFDKKTRKMMRIDYENTTLYIDKRELDLSFLDEFAEPVTPKRSASSSEG